MKVAIQRLILIKQKLVCGSVKTKGLQCTNHGGQSLQGISYKTNVLMHKASSIAENL